MVCCVGLQILNTNCTETGKFCALAIDYSHKRQISDEKRATSGMYATGGGKAMMFSRGLIRGRTLNGTDCAVFLDALTASQ